MPQDPLSEEARIMRSAQIRVGQIRARAHGRVGGRRIVYSDAAIREAIRLHDSGATWAAAAAAVGISVENLYTRLRKLRREDADAKAT